MNEFLQLIVGLGNPGPQYSDTRHNAGAQFVEAVASRYGGKLRAEPKFFGLVARITIDGFDLRLLVPTTMMNLSGRAVTACASYYRVPPQLILVAHDELDFPPGSARFKQGGGAGGHNGLKDVIGALGSPAFHRLRLGIGHPGFAHLVHDYVLTKPSAPDRCKIQAAIDESLDALPYAIRLEWPLAMNRLHSFDAGALGDSA